MKSLNILKKSLFFIVLISPLAIADMSITYSSDDNNQTIRSYNNSSNVYYYDGYRQYQMYDPNYTTESTYQYISPNTTIIIRDNIRPIYPQPPVYYYPYNPRPNYHNHYHRPRNDYNRPQPKVFPNRPTTGNQNNVPRPPKNMSKPINQ